MSDMKRVEIPKHLALLGKRHEISRVRRLELTLREEGEEASMQHRPHATKDMFTEFSRWPKGGASLIINSMRQEVGGQIKDEMQGHTSFQRVPWEMTKWYRILSTEDADTLAAADARVQQASADRDALTKKLWKKGKPFTEKRAQEFIEQLDQ